MKKQEIFKKVLNGNSSYAIVKYDDVEELIWVSCYKNFDEDGDWYLEAPTHLVRFDNFDLKDGNCLKFIEEMGLIIYKGEVYEIFSPQTSPFLPDDFEIELVDELCMLKNLISKGLERRTR